MRKLLGAAIAATAIALAAAPIASADNVTYLSRLNSEYGTVYDTGMSLSTGYEICSRLGYENGIDTATWLYYWGGSDVPTLYAAGQWVVIAAQELCPWHDHTYDAPAPPQLLYAL